MKFKTFFRVTFSKSQYAEITEYNFEHEGEAYNFFHSTPASQRDHLLKVEAEGGKDNIYSEKITILE